MNAETTIKENSRHSGARRLLLGVDGGGTKTAALVATLDSDDNVHVLGSGRGGPSNLRLAGRERSLASLDAAVDQAMSSAGCGGASVDCAVLALAGSSSRDIHTAVTRWAEERRLTTDLHIVHDADPLLAVGAPDGFGVAAIVGTGSVAVGLDSIGNSARKGGWGHWFSDKGSGFDIGRMALSAVAEASDGIGPQTMLLHTIQERLGCAEARQFLKKIIESGDVRREIAALAPLVLEAALEGDGVAVQIETTAAGEIARLVSAVADSLTFAEPYPLALGGGIVCGSHRFRERLIHQLEVMGAVPGTITCVNEPVEACLELARSKLQARRMVSGI